VWVLFVTAVFLCATTLVPRSSRTWRETDSPALTRACSVRAPGAPRVQEAATRLAATLVSVVVGVLGVLPVALSGVLGVVVDEPLDRFAALSRK
jgi:hypothetical protein